jgi:hypothetical protein
MVGAISPFSKSFAMTGSVMRNGMLMAFEELKYSNSMEVIFKDDQSFNYFAGFDAATK